MEEKWRGKVEKDGEIETWKRMETWRHGGEEMRNKKAERIQQLFPYPHHTVSVGGKDSPSSDCQTRNQLGLVLELSLGL